MNFYIQLLIWVVVIGVVFGVLWRTGQLLRLAGEGVMGDVRAIAVFNPSPEGEGLCGWQGLRE